MKKEKKAGSSHILSAVITAVVMLVGIALVLYPTIADKINDAVNGKAISDYKKQVLKISDDEYEEMLNAAREYNDHLFRYEPYIGALTEEERKEYSSLLDVDGSGMMGYIEIPKSKIYLAIYHGTDESVLQTGAGHLEASSLPVTGESVHVVLSGHSGLPSARLFTDLDQLDIGDNFTLHVLRETLTYKVENIRRVSPDELKNLRIEEGSEICTLMTCTPYGINTHRLVITARRIETPVEEKHEETQIIRAVKSKWNRWFVFLPVVMFAGMIATFIIVKKKKKKQKEI